MNHRKSNPILLIFFRFSLLYLVVGFLLRIVLTFCVPSEDSLTLGQVLLSLLLGVVADASMVVWLCLPLYLIYLALGEYKYNRKVGLAILVLLLAGFVYSFMPFSIFKQYGGGAPIVAQVLLGWKLLSFATRYFMPGIRFPWRRASLYFCWGLYVFLLLGVSVSEYIFWDEFGVRYNFIAVDYLIYTNEVVGNIMESYAVVPMVAGVALLAIGIVWWQSRHISMKVKQIHTPRMLLIHSIIYFLLCGISLLLLNVTHRYESSNQYATQIGQNGACDFVIAFQSHQLDYDQFYALIPEEQCAQMYAEQTGLAADGYRMIGDSLPADRPNIVLITVESLSADFMTRHGNADTLTPQLDKLALEGIAFDRLYANGNRTVRGLEALSLCVPPCAGESVIKRPQNNMGDRSVGQVLAAQGYQVQFLYGGDSYFDNMGDYFSHNGYQVIDRSQIAESEVVFSNIWGVSDEDIFHKSLQVFDDDAKQGHPFFAHIMTTSNHRPYTYPEGRIDDSRFPHSRRAAVRYTDYAIGDFIRQAKSRSWFDNTVFVIIADHCASSAGKTSIPVDRYHIPCIIYSPSRFQPQAVSTLCSQIDIMPTLLSLLHIPARVAFAGQNVFAPTFQPRAFMATYQNLGYLEDDVLTVLSPVCKTQQYDVKTLDDGTHEEQPISTPRNDLLLKAQAYYQYTNLQSPKPKPEAK